MPTATEAQMRARGYSQLSPAGPVWQIWARPGGTAEDPIYRNSSSGDLRKYEGDAPDQRSHSDAELVDIIADIVRVFVQAGVPISSAELQRIRGRLRHLRGAHTSASLKPPR